MNHNLNAIQNDSVDLIYVNKNKNWIYISQIKIINQFYIVLHPKTSQVHINNILKFS